MPKATRALARAMLCRQGMLSRLSRRGATQVEYILILSLVVVPSVALFVVCFARVYLWYLGFTTVVSQSTP